MGIREIIFRGKCIKTGNWVYGGYVHQKEYYGDECDKHYIVDGNDFNNCDAYCEHHAIDKETLGQYTGLKDKDGNKIFEGDIVVFHNTLTLIKHFEGKVKYYDNCKPIISKNNTHIDLAECDRNELSVIGNIHDKEEIRHGQ